MAVHPGKLKPNVLNLGDAIILGLASSGPAQTMAASLAALVAASHYAGLLPILLSFLPMVGIALGYQRLNRWQQSAGATYTWVAKVFHPYLGFLAGWMILLYYTLGTTSLTLPAGTYTLELVSPGLAQNNVAVSLVGAAWDVAVTLMLLQGIKIAARFQWVLAVFEYAVLLFFAVLGVAAMAGGHAAVPVSASWFTVQGAGGLKGLLAGILVAVFMYSGWDAAIYVNEETTESPENPGRAAIASVIILLFLYGFTTFAYQGILPGPTLANQAGNALAAVAAHLAGTPGRLLMSLIVLTGTVASLQAAVISAARLGFAMAKDRVMPGSFALVDGRTGSPWVATLVMGGVNLLFLLLSSWLNRSVGQALANIVSALGLLAALFYVLTALAAVWYYRRVLWQSAGNFLLGGLLPLLGAAFLLWVVVESIVTQATTPVVLAYGLGAAALAFPVALVIRMAGVSSFFRTGAQGGEALTEAADK